MGILLGILIGAVLLFLIYAKSVDSLIKDQERAREKEAIVDKVLDYMNEIDMIKDWNEQVVVKPREEGK